MMAVMAILAGFPAIVSCSYLALRFLLKLAATRAGADGSAVTSRQRSLVACSAAEVIRQAVSFYDPTETKLASKAALLRLAGWDSDWRPILEEPMIAGPG
jgi:hypothetical protein